jgi:hypothetical protein
MNFQEISVKQAESRLTTVVILIGATPLALMNFLRAPKTGHQGNPLCPDELSRSGVKQAVFGSSGSSG